MANASNSFGDEKLRADFKAFWAKTVGDESLAPDNDIPCKKIWECLRRNEAFQKLVKREQERPKEIRVASWIETVGDAYWTNKFAYVALSFLLPVMPDPKKKVSPSIDSEANDYCECERSLDLSTPWKDSDEHFRRMMLWSWKDALLPLPRRYEEYVYALGEREPIPAIARRKFINNPKALLDHNLETEDVIIIPKIIRDEEHRKKIIETIDSWIPHPKKSHRDKRGLGKRGAFLGTETDWEVYERYRRFREKGVSERHARGLVSIWLDERETFEGLSEVELLGERGLQAAKEIYPRRESRIRDHIDAIEKAIGSVYPKFNLLV